MRTTPSPLSQIPCQECRYCEDGKAHLCPNTTAIGWDTGAGGFAENAVVPEQQVHILSDSVPVEGGALVEPLAVGLHAVRQSGMQAGATVAMFGRGPIGLTVIRAAKAAGAKRIFASEPNDIRRETALDLGANDAIDPLETDAVEYIKSETSDGVGFAFEFAGLDATFNAAINSTVRDGTITVGELSNSETSIHLNDIVTTERSVIGTNCMSSDHNRSEASSTRLFSRLPMVKLTLNPSLRGASNWRKSPNWASIRCSTPKQIT